MTTDPIDPAVSSDPNLTVSDEVTRLTEEVKKLSEIAARAQADYINLQRRSESEKADMTFFLTRKLFLTFLPTIDNLDRALTNAPPEMKDSTWLAGLVSMRQGLTRELEKLSIVPFESIGTPADPALHEVLSSMPGEEGIILQEFEKGWKIGERVLRHAKVITGNGEVSTPDLSEAL